MKKYLLIFIAALIFLNVSGSNEVSAQSVKSLKVEVKFDFHIGDKIYPAGVYRLESVSPGNENILSLSGSEKKSRQLIITNSSYADKRQQPKLVFQQVGEVYYLTDIFMTDGNWGFSVHPSRRQVEKSKNLASTKFIEIPAKN